MPKCAKGKSDVYNLITTHVVDPVEMNRLLKEEKDKKQRHLIRNKFEKFYRERNFSKDFQDETRKKNKVSFERFKIEDKRQYNIISLKDKPYQENKKNVNKGYNTFDKKQIYREPYD